MPVCFRFHFQNLHNGSHLKALKESAHLRPFTLIHCSQSFSTHHYVTEWQSLQDSLQIIRYTDTKGFQESSSLVNESMISENYSQLAINQSGVKGIFDDSHWINTFNINLNSDHWSQILSNFREIKWVSTSQNQAVQCNLTTHRSILEKFGFEEISCKRVIWLWILTEGWKSDTKTDFTDICN